LVSSRLVSSFSYPCIDPQKWHVPENGGLSPCHFHSLHPFHDYAQTLRYVTSHQTCQIRFSSISCSCVGSPSSRRETFVARISPPLVIVGHCISWNCLGTAATATTLHVAPTPFQTRIINTGDALLPLFGGYVLYIFRRRVWGNLMLLVLVLGQMVLLGVDEALLLLLVGLLLALLHFGVVGLVVLGRRVGCCCWVGRGWRVLEIGRLGGGHLDWWRAAVCP
jgi:hypothetical protein